MTDVKLIDLRSLRRIWEALYANSIAVLSRQTSPTKLET